MCVRAGVDSNVCRLVSLGLLEGLLSGLMRLAVSLELRVEWIKAQPSSKEEKQKKKRYSNGEAVAVGGIEIFFLA